MDYETIDEFRARGFYLSIDLGVNGKYQDDYYSEDENTKKDMLGSELPFDKQQLISLNFQFRYFHQL